MKAGDKVVCVDDSPCVCCDMRPLVVKGRVYVVASTYGHTYTYGERPTLLILVLVGVPAQEDHMIGYPAIRFRLLDVMRAEAKVKAQKGMKA